MQILLINITDNSTAHCTFLAQLYAEKFSVDVVDSLDGISPYLRAKTPNIVILCYPDKFLLEKSKAFFHHENEIDPILIAVLSDENEMAPHLLEAGIDDFLVEPIDTDHLRLRLRVAEYRMRRRRRVGEALWESRLKVRAILDNTVDCIITIDEHGKILSFNKAAEKIFGYTQSEVIGEKINMLMPEPFAEEHDSYLHNYKETAKPKIIGIGREEVALRKDGSIFPMELAVSEVIIGEKRIFTGIIRDISERRRLEREILNVSDLERRRIGQDLHDGLGQMLTGITLINSSLARRLKKTNNACATEVAEVTDLIKEADQYARILARSLVPVELEADGLSSALARLAQNGEKLFDIRCVYRPTGSGLIHDNQVAINLYRITQEAISNAVKHGQANHVLITLAFGEKHTRLRITDNGTGFPDKLPKERGMGINIMEYRAKLIGGSLEISNRQAGGAIITVSRERRKFSPSNDINEE